MSPARQHTPYADATLLRAPPLFAIFSAMPHTLLLPLMIITHFRYYLPLIDFRHYSFTTLLLLSLCQRSPRFHAKMLIFHRHHHFAPRRSIRR